MALTTIVLACLLFLLSVASLLLIISSSTRQNDKRLNLPPGPLNLPIIGSLHRFGELPHVSLHKLSRKHGPIMYLKLGSVPTVVASSADAAREFLKTHDLDCCSRPLLTSLRRLTYNFSDVVFSPYGAQWRELRKVCIVHLFSAKKVARARYIREEEVERMIDSVSSRCAAGNNNSIINLSEELYCLASDITCRTALGKRYFSGDGGTLRRILGETQALFNAFFFADYIPMLGWLDWLTGARARLERNFTELDQFYQKVIDEHLNPAMRQDERDEDAIDALLDIEKNTTSLTHDHIKGVLMNIFVAGSDTSSATIEWAMMELMRNPEAMRRAEDEVRALAASKRMVEESDLERLPYLKAVVKETMRVHGIVPLLVQRETIRDFKVDGYDVPARTRLLVNGWVIGRDESVWERPEDFWPERFMSCTSEDLGGHDFRLIPFGGGRRICPGMNAGTLVTELGLANLLYHFDWKLPEGMSKEDVDMEEAPGVTVHRKSALCLVASGYCRANE